VLALVFYEFGPSWGLDTSSAQHVRLAFIMAAIWYGLFSLPLFLLTPDQPGTGKGVGQVIVEGLAQLRDTLSHVRQYRDIVWFLVARMIYIDGLGTVFAFGGIYARETFQMNELAFGIAINVTAGLGAASFAWIDDYLGSRRTILLSLASLLGCGLVLVIAPNAAWFWVFGLILGIFIGPVQAASRSYLARLAPAHLRNEIFGLYALSGKATAFAGPLLVGTLTHFSGSRRVGMASLLLFFALGMAVMWRLPNIVVRPRRAG
jgi:UMF1 family MFS transporter